MLGSALPGKCAFLVPEDGTLPLDCVTQ